MKLHVHEVKAIVDTLETRRELAIYGNGIWFDWHKNEKGVLRSEKDTLEGFPKKEKKPNLLLEGIRAIRKKYCPKITWFD